LIKQRKASEKNPIIFEFKKLNFLMIEAWQSNPVLTTVTSTALPISQVTFPAVTICSEGEKRLG
jgi:hypothetical protein